MMSRSQTITEQKMKGVTMPPLRNPHPGEILKEEFLDEIGMSQNQLAEGIGVPGNRIHAIVKGWRHHRRYRFAPVQVLRPLGRVFPAAAERL